ncbi:hypothetical protein PT974_01664 [Cladobotryum mycophilum]|uniref:SSCRP protein n=1 Tax=Cladobotryum mycophilum TaxID=491253 RepID=A0ABR0T5P2_9HYPO
MYISQIIAAAMLAATATAVPAPAERASTQIQLNYFSDSSCHNYQGKVDVTWATSLYDTKHNNCYNYQYGNSVGIANCNTDGGCLCNFYYQSNCQGGATQQLQGPAHGTGGCVGGAQQLKSFSCYYR